MNDFVIVAVALLLFLGFGVAMGVLIVSAFSRRRAYRYLEDDHQKLPPPDGTYWYPEDDRQPLPPPEDDDQPPRWPGR